jgi:hypothetical protein
MLCCADILEMFDWLVAPMVRSGGLSVWQAFFFGRHEND